ncbi:YpzI family protein [Bacillus solimangrovi]|uniref:YpzI family protein n=1 Tax=Bacillus solimangrovi TaxID=1305675 RepID=A0A1E5LHB5_9BACI|nr:YpzI family protein [Bacillus solimangrovi]OEH93471.1 YpzI family protein [Bacillus solimangrovi]
MGKDRQEKKLRKKEGLENDRDQRLNYKGSTTMESPEEARNRNRQ